MTRIIAIAAVLLTAACGQQDQPAPALAANGTAVPAAPVIKPKVASLKGRWKVAGTNGLVATFSGAQVVLAEGCSERAWTYTQNGNSVSFVTAPGGSSNCGRVPSVAMDQAFGPLSDANLAVFSADGDEVTLSGLGGSLQLARR